MAIVFTDTYTVGADIDLASYPSGSPDYAYNLGAAGDLMVVAVPDRVEARDASLDLLARITDPAVPTGDQEIIATIARVLANINGSFEVGPRWATAAPLGNGYFMFMDLTAANEVQLFRVDGGVPVLLDSVDRGFPNAAVTVQVRIRATGAGATVTLIYQIDATATQTFADSSANRKTSGRPGVGAFRGAGQAAVFIDTVTVDDLTERHQTRHLLQAVGLH